MESKLKVLWWCLLLGNGINIGQKIGPKIGQMIGQKIGQNTTLLIGKEKSFGGSVSKPNKRKR